MYYKTPFLETKRLYLKKGDMNDYEKVYEYDFRKLRNIAGEFEFEKLDSSVIKGFATYATECEDVYDWIIYLKDNTPIANVTADREIKEIHSIELAFNLHPNYWGKGYMKEAVLEIMNYLYKSGFENIMCGYSEGNIKSKRLQEKIGFELYKVEPCAWQKNNIPITDYKTIMEKDTFYNLYSEYLNSDKKI